MRKHLKGMNTWYQHWPCLDLTLAISISSSSWCCLNLLSVILLCAFSSRSNCSVNFKWKLVFPFLKAFELFFEDFWAFLFCWFYFRWWAKSLCNEIIHNDIWSFHSLHTLLKNIAFVIRTTLKNISCAQRSTAFEGEKIITWMDEVRFLSLASYGQAHCVVLWNVVCLVVSIWRERIIDTMSLSKNFDTLI